MKKLKKAKVKKTKAKKVAVEDIDVLTAQVMKGMAASRKKIQEWFDSLPQFLFRDAEGARRYDGLLEWMEKTKDLEGNPLIDTVRKECPLESNQQYHVVSVHPIFHPHRAYNLVHCR